MPTNNFFPQVWADQTLNELVRAYRDRQYVSNTVVDYTNKVRGMDATSYHGPKIGTLEAYDIPIADSNFQEIAKTAITINFDQHKGVPFIVKDIDETQSNVNLMSECTAAAKESLIEGYDNYIIGIMIKEAATKTKISTSTHLTKEDFVNARKVLNQKKAPKRDRYCLLCADHEADLYNIPEFISRDKIKDSDAVKEGVIGRLMGFDIILANEMPLVNGTSGQVSPTATNDKKVAIFYQKVAIGWGRQKEFKIFAGTNVGGASEMINITSLYGGVAQFPEFIVTMRDN